MTTKVSSEYSALMARRILFLAVVLCVLSAVAVIDIMTGPALLHAFDVLQAIVTPEAIQDNSILVIVRDIRLPMSLMSVVVGASLGVAGVQMQTILGNPLASPFTLGVSSAAGFGAAVIILFGLSFPLFPELTVPFAAFVGAVVACGLVFGLSHLKGVTSEIMVLSGIATLFLFQSLQSLIQYLASPEVLQEIVFWLFGSLLKATWFSVTVSTSIFAICILLTIRDNWKLTALKLGDDRARSLGVNVTHLRLKTLTIVSLLTAGAVAFVGTVGFVGLVAPHVARMLVGDDQRILTPVAAVTGAIIMVGASIVSKLVSPGTVVPIGIVTAVIGVPFLFTLILIKEKGN